MQIKALTLQSEQIIQPEDVAGAHNDDHITLVHALLQLIGNLLKAAVIVGLLTDAIGQLSRTDLRGIDLVPPRGVDIGKENPVGTLECGGKLLKELGCARIGVRLEDAPDPLIPHLGYAVQCRAHLSGVMAVIVKHIGPAEFSLILHTTLSSGVG